MPGNDDASITIYLTTVARTHTSDVLTETDAISPRQISFIQRIQNHEIGRFGLRLLRIEFWYRSNFYQYLDRPSPLKQPLVCNTFE